jgi:hypothetical protein
MLAPQPLPEPFADPVPEPLPPASTCEPASVFTEDELHADMDRTVTNPAKTFLKERGSIGIVSGSLLRTLSFVASSCRMNLFPAQRSQPTALNLSVAA